MERPIAMWTYNTQTMFAYDVCLAGVYEEGHIPSGLNQAAAKVATDRAGADYQDSHRRIMWDSCFPLQSGVDRFPLK
jgi:hypothetical protein